MESLTGVGTSWPSMGISASLFQMDSHLLGEPLIESGDSSTNPGKWGFIDADGQLIVQPTFETAGDFADGMAFVGK